MSAFELTPTERRIVTQVVDDLLAAGLAISVDDGEEVTLSGSFKRSDILKAMATTEENYLRVVQDGRQRFVRLVYGNGCDVICDYSTSLERVLAKSDALAESLS